MIKYPTKYHVNHNAMAAHNSNDKEEYWFQQKLTKQQLTLTP